MWLLPILRYRVETAVPAFGWWRHQWKVGVEFGMTVAAVDHIEPVDLVEPEPVAIVDGVFSSTAAAVNFLVIYFL